jgi:hypothetical protein
MSERQWGKRFQPVVLHGFAGQRPGAQRSLFADLIFGYFVSRQSNSPPAANERADV